MNNIWMIVGIGCNNIKIPCMVFKNKEDAYKRLEEEEKRIPKDDIEKFNRLLVEAFYTSYYPGCGECYAFEVIEVKFGEKFVR